MFVISTSQMFTEQTLTSKIDLFSDQKLFTQDFLVFAIRDLVRSVVFSVSF